MTKPVRKIARILFVIIILPILAISLREFLSVTEDEKVIENIYSKQLDAILFSANQYSEDVIRSWVTRIQASIDETGGDESKLFGKLKFFFRNNLAVKELFFADSINSLNRIFIRSGNTVSSGNNSDSVALLLSSNSKTISKMYKYKENNYTKIESFDYGPGANRLLIFILDDKRICGINIDRKIFVVQNLSSILQSIGKEEFIVSVFDDRSGKNVYSTEQSASVDFQQKKNLWLIPDYSLGIVLKGRTLDGLVRERAYKNLAIMFILTLFLIILAWYAYRNLKREVELAQIKSDFVSNVSHELRTPLALINMFAETLALGRVGSEGKRNEYYGIIQQETDRLSNIVNRILNFSKFESGKWKYNFGNADLNSVTDKIFTNYKFHLLNKEFEFIYEPAAELPPVKIDGEAVSEALVNLIDNAVKYSRDDKKVVIRTGETGNSVFAEVEDNGIGISGEDQKRIFDKFYRVQTGDVYDTKGTGLGLSLVKHIVDAHGGEIKLTSKLGKGSTFRLIFPTTANN
jgi:two-component system, OmpR family, phosphate regulon sensor histidine kinase PhoR